MRHFFQNMSNGIDALSTTKLLATNKTTQVRSQLSLLTFRQKIKVQVCRLQTTQMKCETVVSDGLCTHLEH